MIRRDVLKRDGRPVKWSLLAAGFALSLGLYAEHALTAQVVVETEVPTAVVQESSVAPAPAVITG